MAIPDHRICIPARGITNSLEAATSGVDMRLQHRSDVLAKRQVGKADNPLRNARRPVPAAVAHGRDASNELGLSHGPHGRWATLAPHRIALQEYGGYDVMATLKICRNFIDQIAVVRIIPEMVMGINDRNLRLQRLFRMLPGQPLRSHSEDPPELPGHGRLVCHEQAHGLTISCVFVVSSARNFGII